MLGRVNTLADMMYPLPLRVEKPDLDSHVANLLAHETARVHRAQYLLNFVEVNINALFSSDLRLIKFRLNEVH
jgi:hypothetical protein